MRPLTKITSISLGATLLLILALIISTSIVRHVPFLTGLTAFASLFYQPHYNIFVLVRVWGRPVYFYLYVLGGLLTLLTWACCWKNFKGRRGQGFRQTLLVNTLIMISVTAFLQMLTQTAILRTDVRTYGGKSVAGRYIELFPYTYYFAATCRHLYPGRHSGVLMTDLDLTDDYGMTIQRHLAYFLYPLDIRDIRHEKPDALILFEKANAADYVPDDYRILKTFGPRYLLAVKKSAMP